MDKRTRILTVLGVALVAGIVVWVTGKEPTPEERINRLIDEATTAAHERDLGALVEPVSESFSARGMDRRGLKAMLFVQLRKGAWRRLFVTEREVEVSSPQEASAILHVLMATGQDIQKLEDVVPTDAGYYRIELSLRLEDDEWRVISADYRSLSWPGPG